MFFRIHAFQGPGPGFRSKRLIDYLYTQINKINFIYNACNCFNLLCYPPAYSCMRFLVLLSRFHEIKYKLFLWNVLLLIFHNFLAQMLKISFCMSD